MPRLVTCAALLAIVLASPARAITFTPGHIYANDDTAIYEYDHSGALLGSLSYSGGEVVGTAFGPDGYLYVSRVSGTVDAIRADGSVVRSYSAPGQLRAGGNIAFDPTGQSFYVTAGGDVFHFDVGSPTGSVFLNDGYFYYDAAPALDGQVLVTSGYDVELRSGTGALLSQSYALFDPLSLLGELHPSIVDARSLAYDSIFDETYMFMLGSSAGSPDTYDQYYKVLSLGGTSATLRAWATYISVSDLYATDDHRLLVAGFRSQSAILDAQTLAVIAYLDFPGNTDAVHITAMPLREPALGGVALLAIVAALIPGVWRDGLDHRPTWEHPRVRPGGRHGEETAS